METSEPGANRDTGVPAGRNTTLPIDHQQYMSITSLLSTDSGLSPSSSLVTTRRSPSYPYVAGPVDLAGMVTPDRFAPGTAAGEALKFVSQWA